MDEKTEQLRDIFMDVSDEAAVTESQASGHGSLTDTDEARVDERLASVVSRMRERYSFDSDFDDAALVTVIRGFYAGQTDAEIAAELDATERAVQSARFDLHLLRDADAEADFDVTEFRRRVIGESATDTAALAVQFDVSEATAAHYRRVVEAQAAARGVSHRFQSEFEDVLAEAGLSMQLTATIRDTGLDDATEDIDSLDSDADISM